MGQVKEHWISYLEGTAEEAEEAMEETIALCEEALRGGDVPRLTIDAVLNVSYARLMCARLALGRKSEALVAYHLSRCAFLHHLLEHPYSHMKADEICDALEKSSMRTKEWLALALDIEGRNGRLPRYVEEHCEVFRDVLEAHGVSCPGEGSEQTQEKAGGSGADRSLQEAE